MLDSVFVRIPFARSELCVLEDNDRWRGAGGGVGWREGINQIILVLRTIPALARLYHSLSSPD